MCNSTLVTSFEHRKQFLKFTDVKLLTVRGMCPNCRNERGGGGRERCFMLLDVSNEQNLVVCLGGLLLEV